MIPLRRFAGILALVLGLVVAAGGAAAQSAPAAKIDQARELFLVIWGDTLRQALHQQSLVLVTMQFAQVQPPIPSADVLQVLGEELDGAIDQNLPVLADQVAVTYAEAFTAEEMDAILNSAKGPASESFMAKMPAVADKTKDLIRAWQISVLSGLIEPIYERLREKGHLHLR